LTIFFGETSVEVGGEDKGVVVKEDEEEDEEDGLFVLVGEREDDEGELELELERDFESLDSLFEDELVGDVTTEFEGEDLGVCLVVVVFTVEEVFVEDEVLVDGIGKLGMIGEVFEELVAEEVETIGFDVF
jgi:hypothetical protein